MNIKSLLIGLVAGLVIGIMIMKFSGISQANNSSSLTANQSKVSETVTIPDTLDALKAAADSHKIIFEDSSVRILQVILYPHKTEPIHTHQWKSVMWFTKATPMIYYKAVIENSKPIIKDSISIPQMPAEVLNHGELMDAEGPHAIKNLGNQQGIAYRIEFKK